MNHNNSHFEFICFHFQQFATLWTMDYLIIPLHFSCLNRIYFVKLCPTLEAMRSVSELLLDYERHLQQQPEMYSWHFNETKKISSHILKKVTVSALITGMSYLPSQVSVFPLNHCPLTSSPLCPPMQTVCFLPVFVQVLHMNPINSGHSPKMDDVLCRQGGLRKKKSVCVICV